MGSLPAAVEALRIARELTGPAGPKALRARIHAALGEWAVEVGEEKEAVRELDAAAQLAVEIGDSALAAATLARRGRLALRRKSWDEARTTLTKALGQERATRDDVAAARTMLDLAEIELAQGKPKEARAHATEALALARATTSPATLARAIALDAQSRFDDEDVDALIERLRAGAREALTMLETNHIPTTARFEAALDLLLLVATDAAIEANAAETLLAAGEFGRSRRLLHALGGRSALMAALTPPDLEGEIETTRAAEKAALEEFERQHEKMAREPMLRARDEARKLKVKLDELEQRRLATLSSAAWLLSPGVPTLDAVEGALGPNETLLYYCVGTRSAAVLEVTSGGSDIVKVGDRPELDERIAALRDALRTDEPYPALKEFAQAHMARFGLSAGRDVVVVPAHPFDHVPFAAVAPEQTFRYVASAADLIRLAEEGKKSGNGVLGVGNPSYGSGEVQLRLVHLRNGLPIRQLEKNGTFAEEIADLALTGANATEKELAAAVGRRDRWRAIQLAVPGLLDSRRPYRSSLTLAPGDDGDGLLTVYEMMAMGLPADLTVLAACEPAKGERDTERAVNGVTQAIQLAGSARVIISAWWVDDAAASTLMTHFYRFWADGNTSAPLALRRAQHKVSALPGWVHPRSWAGWQLWGAR